MSKAFFESKHGFNGNSEDLKEIKGFDEYSDFKMSDWFETGKTLQDMANWVAANEEGAIGFACDPEFFTVNGEQNANVIFRYTNKSPTCESWPLYLFDEAEANKEA